MTLGNGKNKVNRGLSDWDNQAPSAELFNEILRVSKNAVIWGANHFISKLPYDSSCWIVWDKGTGNNDFADCELAWTSFHKTVRKYFQSWVGANAKEKTDKHRIHPTQKPVALYAWLLDKYAIGGVRYLTRFSAVAAVELRHIKKGLISTLASWTKTTSKRRRRDLGKSA
jgi:site-specific DNA-methyltransferase (adenine-specific)